MTGQVRLMFTGSLGGVASAASGWAGIQIEVGEVMGVR